ncbi:hypothetical protein lilo_0957 [Lactococcus lactis subsp. lactis IO-1]|nr:hypothetical protein lilo_0957 [Lactococcus lactis subsp. lactis IO-1]
MILYGILKKKKIVGFLVQLLVISVHLLISPYLFTNNRNYCQNFCYDVIRYL